MRYKRWIAAGLVAASLVTAVVGGAVNFDGRTVEIDDPIAFTGHGVMIDREGRPIDVTPEFIEEVQAMYLGALSQLATPSQREGLAAETSRLLDGRGWDPQSRLIINSALIDWLLDEVDPIGRLTDIRGKNKLIQWYLQSRLFEPRMGDRFAHPDQLIELLAERARSGTRVAAETPLADKLAYIEDCKSCGVPIPPDWGPANFGAGKWVKIGVPLPREYNFLWSAGTGFVEVYKYTSADPVGWCIALPRSADAAGDIKLLGIICVGKASSRACFWDNQRDGVPFDIAKTANVALTDFDGGPGLKKGEAGPGTCTACHAGENPYIVHPGTALETASEFADDWYKPLVHPSWPQNPGPSDLLVTVMPDAATPAAANAGCLSCHRQGAGRAGRFPTISKHLDMNYCFIVDRATRPSTATESYTMPSDDVQGTYPNHTSALLAECAKNRPFPAFTINGVNPAPLDFPWSARLS